MESKDGLCGYNVGKRVRLKIHPYAEGTITQAGCSAIPFNPPIFMCETDDGQVIDFLFMQEMELLKED